MNKPDSWVPPPDESLETMAREWIRNKRGMLWPESEAESLVALLRRRDEQWAKMLDPKNEGTDYGKFLADPERAKALWDERVKLAEGERDERAKRIVEKVRTSPPTIDKNPKGGISPIAFMAAINAVCDEFKRRLEADDD
jgi:hypothetical protein